MSVERIANLLEESIIKAVGKNQRIAVAFSGGVDSTTIAKIASKYCEVDLITVGMEDSADIIASRECAKEMSMELNEVIVDEKMLEQAYKSAWKLKEGTLVDVELMAVVYLICKKAAELENKIVLFGSGAEELFIGYSKYYEAYEQGKNLDKILIQEIMTLPDRDIARACMVAQHFGLIAKTPFMDKELVDYVLSIPAKDRIGPKEMKKPLIRQVAKLFAVPIDAIERQKKAMQYGSNVHKTFLKLLKEAKIEAQKPRPPFCYD
jgi:asparagine synthase (glutamine-hydrolysing)